MANATQSYVGPTPVVSGVTTVTMAPIGYLILPTGQSYSSVLSYQMTDPATKVPGPRYLSAYFPLILNTGKSVLDPRPVGLNSLGGGATQQNASTGQLYPLGRN